MTCPLTRQKATTSRQPQQTDVVMQLKARIINALRTFPTEIQQANSELLERTVNATLIRLAH